MQGQDKGRGHKHGNGLAVHPATSGRFEVDASLLVGTAQRGDDERLPPPGKKRRRRLIRRRFGHGTAPVEVGAQKKFRKRAGPRGARDRATPPEGSWSAQIPLEFASTEY